MTSGMARLVALGIVGAVATGCGFHGTQGAPDGGIDGDGSGTIDGCTSFLTTLDTCQLAFGPALMMTGMATYDSGTQTLTVAGAPMTISVKTTAIAGDMVDVIAAQQVALAGSTTLRVTGPHAVALIASDSITIATDSLIDVSDGGAGVPTTCAGAAMPGEDSGPGGNKGGAGGGGGGFGDNGGDGGNGNKDAPKDTQGGMMGHEVVTIPAGLHGGCAGAVGGAGDAPGGAGGNGGGALYLAAGNLIELDGTAHVYAAGGGGKGGQHVAAGGDAGGGGGGSGGMLVIEAPHLMMATTTSITANGGGGGEGSDSGNAGMDGTAGTATTSRASGGGGLAQTGADGGRGGSLETTAGENVTAVLDGGGGGGGGGVGIIRILSADKHLGVISPDPR